MACFSPFPACRRDVFVKQKRRIRETKETYSWNKRDVFVRPSTRIHATTLSRAHDPCARCQKSHLHGSLEPIPSMGLRIHLFCFTNTSLLFHEYVSFVSRIRLLCFTNTLLHVRAHDPCAQCQKSHLHGSLQPIPCVYPTRQKRRTRTNKETNLWDNRDIFMRQKSR